MFEKNKSVHIIVFQFINLIDEYIWMLCVRLIYF